MSNSPDRLTAALNQVKKDVRMLINPKTYENMSQNQIIGALTVLLLVVGIAAGVYLGGQQQELRQQASVAYPQCSNTTGACDGVGAGGRCIGLAGTCQNSETNAFCTCVPDTATPTIQACVIDGQSCNSGSLCCGGTSKCIGGTCQAQYCDRNGPGTTECGDVPLDTHCGFNGTGRCTPTTVDQANAECVCTGAQPTATPVVICQAPETCNTLGDCPVGPHTICATSGGLAIAQCCVPNTPRPTNTSVPNTPGAPTNTPVPLPTTVPPTGVPPTNVPPTNTPTRTPTPTNTPTGTLSPTLTPSSTPVIAPICVNVVMNNPASATPNTPPNVGDVVTLTCSQVAGATRYEFRFRLPDLSFVNLSPSTATITVSQQYQIPSAGSFTAYCRPCAGADASTCAPWEN